MFNQSPNISGFIEAGGFAGSAGSPVPLDFGTNDIQFLNPVTKTSGAPILKNNISKIMAAKPENSNSFKWGYLAIAIIILALLSYLILK